MREYKQLLLANKAWSQELLEERPDFFQRQTVGQKPEFLWIGCSDSRVSAEQLTMSPPGGMFLHRNIANLVHDDDLNLMSVLQYAVDVLRVRHIILCGHHGCGGVKAALAGGTTGPVDVWLENARNVRDAHKEELDALPDEESRVNRLVEMNVRDQIVRLARTPTVQNAFAEERELWLHGWVYDIRDGLIKPLMEIDATTVLGDIGKPERVLLSNAEMEAVGVSEGV